MMLTKVLWVLAFLGTTQAFAATPSVLTGSIVLNGKTYAITVSPNMDLQSYMSGIVKLGTDGYKIDSVDESPDGQITAARGNNSESGPTSTLTIVRNKSSTSGLSIATIKTNLSQLGFKNPLIEIVCNDQSNAFVIQTDQSNGDNIGNCVQFK